MTDLLHVDLTSKKEGQSYLSQLIKEKKQPQGRYLIFGSNNGPAILRNDGWKLRYYMKENTSELFYLPDDPQERNNRSDQYPEKVEALKQISLQECNGNLKNGIYRAG